MIIIGERINSSCRRIGQAIRARDGGVIQREALRQELAATYHYLNPMVLLRQINEKLEHLCMLAEYPAQQKKGRSHNDSVTPIYDAATRAR